MNSITAYILGEVINFRCIAASVSYGLEQYLGGYYQVWLSFANYLIVFPYLTDHVQAEDIPEDLSGKIGSVSHLQNHSAKETE